jgi:hypothetical protein
MIGRRTIRGASLVVLLVLIGVLGTGVFDRAPSQADPAGPSETSNSTEVADLIQQEGEQDYPDIFAGAELTDTGDVRVYTTTADNGLLSYAENEGTDYGVTVDSQVVATDWSDLMAHTSAIADQYDALASDGINLASDWPDIDANDVLVTLAPSPVPHPTDQEYVSDAQADIDAIVGPGAATVSSEIDSDPLIQGDSRDEDISTPYTGADGIKLITKNPNGEFCTDSWEVFYEPNYPQKGVLTAGHCAAAGVDVEMKGDNDIDLGSTGKRHYEGAAHSDFEWVGTDEEDEIWQSGSNKHTPIEIEDPALGSFVTINGDVSEEHTNLKIETIVGCESVSGVYTCGLDRTSNSSHACTGGDSGGPVYHRLVDTPTGNVSIAGIFVGYNDEVCDFETAAFIVDNSDFVFNLN